MTQDTWPCNICGESKPIELMAPHRTQCRLCRAAMKREQRAASRPTLTCLYCGTEFVRGANGSQKMCSVECSRNRARFMAGTAIPTQARCSECGGSFLKPRPTSKHCSRICADRQRDRIRRATPEHKAAVAARHKTYHAANRERLNAQSAAWRAANREHHNELSRAWARAHKHSSPRSWRSQNLPAKAAIQRTRMARLRDATPFPLDHDAVLAKVAYWGNKCWMCGGAFESLDHVKPISRGGLNIVANIRPACVSCNSSKHNAWHGPRTLSMFIRQ